MNKLISQGIVSCVSVYLLCTSRRLQTFAKMAPRNRIVELASLIHNKTVLLDDYLTSNGLHTPSLDVNAPLKTNIPEEAEDILAAKASVIEAAAELQALLLGPYELLCPDVGKGDTALRSFF